MTDIIRVKVDHKGVPVADKNMADTTSQNECEKEEIVTENGYTITLWHTKD
jgi:hypothetical protein